MALTFRRYEDTRADDHADDDADAVQKAETLLQLYTGRRQVAAAGSRWRLVRRLGLVRRQIECTAGRHVALGCNNRLKEIGDRRVR